MKRSSQRWKKYREDKKRLRVNLYALLVVAAMIAVAYLLFFSSIFEIRRINIHSEVSFPEGEVDGLKENLIGKNLFVAKLDTLQKYLLSFAEVKEVIIKRKPLHLIDCYIIERKPIAIISGDSPMGVSADGVVFRGKFNLNQLDLPIITGLPSSEHERFSEGMKRAIEVINLFKSIGLENEFEVSEINVSGKDVTLIVGARKRKAIAEIRLGRDRYIAALRKLKAVFELLSREKEFPSIIDLRFNGQVVVR